MDSIVPLSARILVHNYTRLSDHARKLGVRPSSALSTIVSTHLPYIADGAPYIRTDSRAARGTRRVKVTFGVPVNQMSTFRTALLRGVTPMPDGTHAACELSVNRLVDECLRLEFGPAPDASPPPESPRPIGRPTLTPGIHLKCVGAYLPASFVAFLRAQTEADPEKPTIAALIRGAVDQYAPALVTRPRAEKALKTPVSGSTWVRTSVHLSPEQLSLLESVAEQMHITSAHALRLCVGYHIKDQLMKAKESE